jgi:hypothetical protein
MLDLPWKGQSRDSRNPNSRQPNPARAAIYRAAALTQWLTAGVLHRKPLEPLPAAPGAGGANGTTGAARLIQERFLLLDFQGIDVDTSHHARIVPANAPRRESEWGISLPGSCFWRKLYRGGGFRRERTGGAVLARPAARRFWLAVSVVAFVIWLLGAASGGPWFLWAAVPLALLMLRRWIAGGPAMTVTADSAAVSGTASGQSRRRRPRLTPPRMRQMPSQ